MRFNEVINVRFDICCWGAFHVYACMNMRLNSIMLALHSFLQRSGVHFLKYSHDCVISEPPYHTPRLTV